MAAHRHPVPAFLPALLLATCLAGGQSAHAADYLRGAYGGEKEAKSTEIDWSGFYGGVHGGVGVGQTDPRAFAAPLAAAALPNSAVQDLLRQTINFKQTNKTGASMGGFVGVNWQWDDVVLGIEADYTRSSIKANSSAGPYSLIRTIGTQDWEVNATSTSRARLSDWATLRLRAGWAMGYIMPFITGGLAFANVDARATTAGTVTVYDVSAPPARPVIAGLGGAFGGVVGRRGIAYGGTLGAGVDMAFFSNFFMRAEWQHIQLASGSQRPDISINTARLAGAVKF